jgi:predicted DNA-binding transcriptional regulator YafY
MKSSRLLSALMMLQGCGRITTRTLAERLEVSERTAHRDMESLCQAGVPLIAHRGAHGGWELPPEWRTRVPGLDEKELRALVMTLPTAPAAPELLSAAEGAWRKLIAAMPRSAQARAASIRERIHIDPTAWGPYTEDVSALPVVQEAVAGDRRLRFVYTPPGSEPAQRIVDPLGLVCKMTVWYLVAQTPRGLRTYRVSRIRDAEVLADRFLRPAAFDLAEYWRTSAAAVKQQRHTYAVTLAATPEAAASVEQWIPVTRNPPGVPRPPRLPTDWIVIGTQFESLGQAKFVCLGLGASARVVAPAELHSLIDAELHRMRRTAGAH